VDKICFKLWEVKPYLPIVAEPMEPVKKRMTMSHKAEDLISSLDKLFNRVTIGTFMERKVKKMRLCADLFVFLHLFLI
jgi:hypothetical protein